jgi:hypothetical protein
MSPIFNFHRKYPKALKDLARETDRLAQAEDDMAKAMLETMRQDDGEDADKRRTTSRPATHQNQDKTRR